MIRALIFDFDGLILDTETPEVQAWQNIYAEFGLEFSLEKWGMIVGGWGLSTFDPVLDLETHLNRPLDGDALRARHHRESDQLTEAQPILPGVVDALQAARRLRLGLAVASSSPHNWVDTHLARLGLLEYFDHVVCADDVAPGRTKPHPDLFLKALQALAVRADQAVVFEDSPNGVRAARAAGIFVVAVPNPVTARLEIKGENLRLASLAGQNLGELLLQANHRG
jgi:HAD superfamily hydrolase (TIGR01509 family)